MNTRHAIALNINIFKQDGFHPAAWLAPETDPDRSYDIRYWQSLARTVEQAGVDALFVADLLFHDERQSRGLPNGWEPISFLSALAAVTERIGVIATVSSTYSHPYNVARQIASLDRISRGRAGLNIVTTGHDASAQNFGGASLPDHDRRYERAAEFIEVVRQLLLSWDEDAIVYDRAAGHLIDPSRVRPIDHRGEFFQVRGPLNTPRSPQGWPVLLQAGASDAGRDLAARYADAVYSVSHEIDDAREYYDDLKGRAAQLGRNPAELKVFKAFGILVEEDSARARERFERLEAAGGGENDGALASVLRISGVDLGALADDEPIPELPDVSVLNNYHTHYSLLRRAIERERLTTIGQLRDYYARRGVTFQTLVGDPAEIVDEIARWYEAGVIDGISLAPAVSQRDVANLAELLIPELVRRGLRAPGVGATTLRERYGLSVPRAVRTSGLAV